VVTTLGTPSFEYEGCCPSRNPKHALGSMRELTFLGLSVLTANSLNLHRSLNFVEFPASTAARAFYDSCTLVISQQGISLP
jgi:hypothetical protein